MANLITIKQLLESVVLDFEPRFVAKDDDGDVYMFDYIPEAIESDGQWIPTVPSGCYAGFGKIKLAEFDGKDWTECIYEAPQKDNK